MRLGSRYAHELLHAMEIAAANMIVVDMPIWDRMILRNHPSTKQKIDSTLTKSYELDRVFGERYVYLRKDL